MSEKEIIDGLRLFLINVEDYENDYIVNNFKYLYDLLDYTKNHIKSFSLGYDYIKDTEERLPIYNISEIFKFVDDYNKRFKIDINLEDLVDRGIIDLSSEYYECLTNDKRDYIIDADGFCKNNGTTVWIDNEGTLNNAFTLIHELSHYKNSKKPYNETRYWFTEALAITEEMIGAYISNQDDEIAYNYYTRTFSSVKSLVKWYKILPIILTYQNFSNVDIDSYSFLFKDSTYLKCYNSFISVINEKYKHLNKDDFKNEDDRKRKVFYSLLEELKYGIGFIVAIHLFTRFKEDNSYMDEIQKMHKLINELSVEEFNAYLGFKDMSIEEVCDPVIEFVNEINKYGKNDVKSL